MVVGCLLVDKKNNLTNLIEIIVKSQLQFYHHEQIEKSEEVLFITWNMEREVIWQLALLLESSNIKVGYGFGDSKEKALKHCEASYEKRVNLM